jgi:hypothetical protein
MTTYAKFDTKHAQFGFEIGAFKLLMIKDSGRPIVYHTSEFKGKKYASIRDLWFDDATNKWMPGKGITVNPADMPRLCKAVSDLGLPKLATSKAEAKTAAKRVAAKVSQGKFRSR